MAWGIVLGFLIAAVNVYAGLKIAYIDTGATTIVLLSFAAFGIGARRFTAREANVAQVVGSSAGTMAVTAGLIGPIPALAIGGHDIAPLAIVVWGSALAVLGTLVALPFRGPLIEIKKLAFPSARATGELIRNLFVDGTARPAVRALAVAAATAAGVTVARDGLALIPGGWMLPIAIAGIPAAQLSIGVGVSPLLVGVGLLVGVRVATSMLLGAAIAWLIIAPRLGIAAPSYATVVAWTLWPGAALMVASSLTTLVLDGHDLIRALRVRSVAAGARVVIALGAAALALIAIGRVGFGVHPAIALLGVALAVVFSAAAMHATGETDTTPAGALGGVAQLAIGATGPGGIAAPLYAGGTANGVAAHSATMLNAWKAGSLVGATPARLVAAQLAGIAVGAIVSAAAYWLIREAYGLGGTAMPVPGAISWKVTADAAAGGLSALPAGIALATLAGAAGGVVLTVAARADRLARVLPSAIAMGMGFILPASFSVTVALAAIAFAAVARRAPAWRERSGPGIASGLIVGEGFAGVVIAAITVLRGLG